MHRLLGIITLLMISADVHAQRPAANAATTLPEEIRAFWTEASDAAKKKERAALERLFAPEFIWIHAYGYIDDRATVIEQILRGFLGRFPIPPNLEAPNEWFVFGDVAVFRGYGKTSDGAPALGTTIMAKRGGRYQLIQIQGTEMQPERQWTTLGAAILETYVGRYAESPADKPYTITREGDALRIGGLLLKPISETVFFDKTGGEWTFHRGADGKVTHFLHRFRGREDRLNKVN